MLELLECVRRLCALRAGDAVTSAGITDDADAGPSALAAGAAGTPVVGRFKEYNDGDERDQRLPREARSAALPLSLALTLTLTLTKVAAAKTAPANEVVAAAEVMLAEAVVTMVLVLEISRPSSCGSLQTLPQGADMQMVQYNY